MYFNETYGCIFRHPVYAAYLSHRRKERFHEHGAVRRLYPTFKTTGGQIVPPEDVHESAVPIFSPETQIWAGRDVTQLRRGGETEFYTGKLWTNRYIIFMTSLGLKTFFGQTNNFEI